MFHPDAALRRVDDVVGMGVFATRPIPRGTLTWTLCRYDQVLSPAAVRAMPEPCRDLIDVYGFANSAGHRVLCWDLGRWVNHSCEANTLPLNETCDVAVRDIAAGEQITCEYGSLGLAWPLACRCGSPRCRGTIGAADPGPLGASWDHLASAVLADARRVPQPLWPMVQDPAALRALLADPAGTTFSTGLGRAAVAGARRP
ncbi:MAG: SET domain-containing protein-lysine N-methyltransferase [Vicinamibacteria bacterium]|nr:SET domain-containing protein-lysine N-methyltransferase [Vicinamibacteria bacterium]